MTSGVFFQRLAPTTGFADTVYCQVLFQQFASPLGHCVSVHADEFGDPLIAAVAEFERLQPRIQATLPFIQHAGEQNDRSF
jgi:hypothetical protein